MVCSKSINWAHQSTAEKPYMCVSTNSCAATENHITLTVLILPFSAKHQSGLKDQLVTTCRNAKGGLAENIVWIPSKISGKHMTKQQNASRTFARNCKSTQCSNNLENVTCLISHPTIFTPLELFVRCPFRIRIKSNSHSVKGRKNKFTFNTKDSEGIIQVEITGFVKKVDLNCSKQNGSLPEGIELIKNNLTFKGPMKESYAGTYVCVASNQQWKLSAECEVEITLEENHWFPTRAVLIALCMLFAGSACFCCILRWHRRKQLVVIPQQYSVQNFGYQTTTEDSHCIKSQQDPGIGAGSVCTPVNSQKNIESTDGVDHSAASKENVKMSKTSMRNVTC
ncbi:uncharacterized protein LOC127575811 [Pristis pectinata]|uniref:uncharacterized protein LOC127575811 n=1 Tax=Pristis pectinata TaxID=685728 RepID=UPI00223CDFD1|nr:uncharacterized protein LOC127575811 [Pristis pectinata]